MDEHDHQTQQNQQVDKIKTKQKTIWKIIILAGHVIIIAVLAVLSWCFIQKNNTNTSLLNKNKAEIVSLKKAIDSARNSAPTNNTSAVKCNDEAVIVPSMPTTTVIENIKQSITSGNTQALEAYMASSVTIVRAASEFTDPNTAPEAVAYVTTFINEPATTSWDFNLSASILSSYGQSSYGQYFPGTAVVGKSNNKKVISFIFDADGKVSMIFTSPSEDLF